MFDFCFWPGESKLFFDILSYLNSLRTQIKHMTCGSQTLDTRQCKIMITERRETNKGNFVIVLAPIHRRTQP